MYYGDEDDDPYAPRIGPAAMPSPRSRFAPYYSGRANTFEDYLEEFEGRAYDCALTDPQRVDVIIRYVAPSLRDFWRSLNGYRSHDWPLFRQSLINVFGSTTPRPQVMRQRLLNYVQDSSRTRMDCEDDVLQYYRQFLCYSAPLVHAGHLTEEDRNAAFWYGFHPEDCKVLWPRLLGKNPFQPSDVPFHFEDVFVCTRGAFAYGSPFPPWLHEQQVQSSSVRCERPVAKHGSRDTYSLREMSRAVASNAETTTTRDELPPSLQSSFTRLPPSSSPSISESQHTQAPSMTIDQPETASTLSTTLRPSASFPTLSHTSLLARSATDSDPLFTSTPPASSPTSSTFLPSVTEDQSEPELAPALFASVPTLPSTPSHVHSAINNFASTPPSSSPTSSTCLPSVTEEQPSSEPEPMPSITPASIFTSTPPCSSSSTFLPSPASVQSSMNSQLEPEPALSSEPLIPPRVPEIASTSHSSSSVPLTNFEYLPSAMVDQPEFEPEHASLSSITPTSPFLPTPPVALEFIADDVPELSSSLPTSQSASLASSSTPLPSGQSFELRVLAQSSACELESSTPSPAVDVAPLSSESTEFSESESSQGEPIAFLLALLEAPPNAPISPCSTQPQQLPEIKMIDSISSPLDITPAFVLSTTRLGHQAPLIYEAPSTLAPHLSHPSPPLLLSRSGLARFNFAFVFVTAAVLASILNISATVSTFARKFQSKIEDFGNNQIGTFNTSSRDVFAQRLRLGQYTPHARRLVFDPGGSAFAPDLGTRRLSQAQVEDMRQFLLLHHARHRPPPFPFHQPSHRFRPRRCRVCVRAGTRRLGDV
ncbi:hypothetical protein EDB89DRAFT_1224214 [Lactarius sanguifluus]|nr:hypothetical protein EDB89DRAFT_1224214 [Lactarius sanguifluus]